MSSVYNWNLVQEKPYLYKPVVLFSVEQVLIRWVRLWDWHMLNGRNIFIWPQLHTAAVWSGMGRALLFCANQCPLSISGTKWKYLGFGYALTVSRDSAKWPACSYLRFCVMSTVNQINKHMLFTSHICTKHWCTHNKV